MGRKSNQSWWLKTKNLVVLVATIVLILFPMLYIQNFIQISSTIEFPLHIRGGVAKNDNVHKLNFNVPRDVKYISDEHFKEDGHEIDVFPFTNNIKLMRVMDNAKSQGAQAMEELNKEARVSSKTNSTVIGEKYCSPSITISNNTSHESGIQYVPIPCGLVFGSTITITGKPRPAQLRYNPLIFREGYVSQFLIELQGSKTRKVGEDLPTILHLNPRLKGDWSREPVIEHNSRYGKNLWGRAHRCNGTKQEEKVDNLPSCEKWLNNKEVMILSQLFNNSYLQKKYYNFEKVKTECNYPLVEGREFSLIIEVGLEGFHITIDGQHISSFPYQPGFSVEEATSIMVDGDVDVNSITITSLPKDDTWKALPIPTTEIDMFVGVMSSTNHFSERMAIRKTWFQSNSVQSSQVVPRFFVALDKNNSINLQLKKEAEYYGDIIILPFLDRYDIVILKTFEICKYGVQNVSAKFIMKCDDDTFVRIDAILEEFQNEPNPRGIYMGNMIEGHYPLHSGKWAVDVEEWPSDLKYPRYANGPGYVLSKDFAQFVVESEEMGKLKIFKMEDVTVGIWAIQFTKGKYPIQYVDNKHMAQGRCTENYLSIHYQSPRNMMCLWDKLLANKNEKCCNRW